MNDNTASAGTTGDYRDQWQHIQWKTLIISTKDYVVFIDNEGDLDWETTREYDARQPSMQNFDLAAHNAILNGAAMLETTPCEGLSKEACVQFKRLIGEALGCSFDHDYPGARRMTQAAKRYVLSRSKETSRRWFLSASFKMTAPFCVAGAIMWLARDWVNVVLGAGGMWLAFAVIGGAIGALFSVIARSGSLKLDPSAGRDLHWMEGASRIWAGAISGFIAGLAVKSGLVLAPLIAGGKLHEVMLLASFVAGTGERLIGSIISTLEPSSNESEEHSDVAEGTGKGGKSE